MNKGNNCILRLSDAESARWRESLALCESYTDAMGCALGLAVASGLASSESEAADNPAVAGLCADLCADLQLAGAWASLKLNNGDEGAEIRKSLEAFTGTGNYWRHAPALVLTDGVRFLAIRAGCWWLVDLINSYQPELRQNQRQREFQSWRFAVLGDRRGVLVLTDEGAEILRREVAPVTFSPLAVSLWVEHLGGCDWVMLLPSEH